MPAYVLVLVEHITDMDTYRGYVAQVLATLAPFGGRFAARTPAPEVLEGAFRPARAVILEFPGVESARAWHTSAAYAPVKALRQSVSTGTLLLLPGYEG